MCDKRKLDINESDLWRSDSGTKVTELANCCRSIHFTLMHISNTVKCLMKRMSNHLTIKTPEKTEIR